MPAFVIVCPDHVHFPAITASSPLAALYVLHAEALGRDAVALIDGVIVFADPVDAELCSGIWRVTRLGGNGPKDSSTTDTDRHARNRVGQVVPSEIAGAGGRLMPGLLPERHEATLAERRAVARARQVSEKRNSAESAQPPCRRCAFYGPLTNGSAVCSEACDDGLWDLIPTQDGTLWT